MNEIIQHDKKYIQEQSIRKDYHSYHRYFFGNFYEKSIVKDNYLNRDYVQNILVLKDKDNNILAKNINQYIHRDQHCNILNDLKQVQEKNMPLYTSLCDILRKIKNLNESIKTFENTKLLKYHNKEVLADSDTKKMFFNYEEVYKAVEEKINKFNLIIKEYNKEIDKINKELSTPILKIKPYKLSPSFVDFFKDYKKISEADRAKCVIELNQKNASEKIISYAIYVYSKEHSLEGFLSDKGNVKNAISNAVMFSTEKEAQNFASRKGFKHTASLIEVEITYKKTISNNLTGPMHQALSSIHEKQNIEKALSSMETEVKIKEVPKTKVNKI